MELKILDLLDLRTKVGAAGVHSFIYSLTCSPNTCQALWQIL